MHTRTWRTEELFCISIFNRSIALNAIRDQAGNKGARQQVLGVQAEGAASPLPWLMLPHVNEGPGFPELPVFQDRQKILILHDT